MNHFSLLLELLRHRKSFLEETYQGVRIKSKTIALLSVNFIFLAVYGAIIGVHHGSLQALSSAVKLPALYLVTLLICLPPLYFLNVLSGSNKSIGQYFVLLLIGVAVNSVLLFSLAPIALFFGLSIRNYKFFQMLNVIIFAIAGIFGVNSFYQGFKFFYERDKQSQTLRLNILRLWLALYAFVGCQMGWILRPFFGTPGKDFQLFRSELESNFYFHVLHLLGFPVK
jgi:hypothetical protein